MSNLRLVILIAVCIVLGGLAWLDNSPQSGSAPIEPGTDYAEPSEPLAGQDKAADDANPSADNANSDDMDAGAYMTAGDQSSSNPLSAIEIGQLRDTVDRPLFASSRRRPPESATQPMDTAATTPTPTFELLGVALGGARPIAILRKKSDGTSYRVQTGDVLAGWQVTKVDPRAVLLERPEGGSENVPLLRK